MIEPFNAPGERETRASAGAADARSVSAGARLDDVVGAILGSLVVAQSQADGATIATARQYARHEVLAHFPITRAQIGLVDLELCVAFIPEPRTLAPQERSRLSSVFVREALELLDHPPADALVQLRPSLATSWYRALPQTMSAINELIDRLVPSDADAAAHELLLLLARALLGLLIEDAGAPPTERVPDLLDGILATRLQPLTDAVRDTFAAAASRQPVQVLYSADALAGVAPQAISRLHIRIDPRNRRIVDVNGQFRVAPE